MEPEVISGVTFEGEDAEKFGLDTAVPLVIEQGEAVNHDGKAVTLGTLIETSGSAERSEP